MARKRYRPLKKQKRVKSSKFLIIIVGIIIFLLSLFLFQQRKSSHTAETLGIQTPSPAQFILNPGDNPIDSYQGLVNPGVSLSYRTRKYDLTPEITTYESKNYGYYVTAASSDYTHFLNAPLYQPLGTLQSIAGNTYLQGFYFHEMLTHLAAINGWSWTKAKNTLDWNWVDSVVMTAKQNGKKVVWSEPTYAWKTIATSTQAAQLLPKWGDTLVPMYATNFTDTEIASAKEYAMLVANQYNLPFGQSHQSWYFRDFDRPITSDGSYNLAMDAWNSGARYFQFEGTFDMNWETSPYVDGIKRFAAFVETALQPTATPTLSPTPIPTFTPTPTSTPTHTPIRKKGDLNGDGIINSTDYSILSSCIKYGSNWSVYCNYGDLNNDGKLNNADLNVLKKLY